MDIDLNVKDKLPLHGSAELNNRASADTKPLRVNASLSYDNLWQLGHSVGASFQRAPQAPDAVKCSPVTISPGCRAWTEG